jgi:hypothetical protein
MLKSDDFPPQYLKTLTHQINDWLGDMFRSGQLRLDHGMESQSAADSFELGEQFVMVVLNDKELRAAQKSENPDLGELVELTGRRHHQIKHQKAAFAYARSLVAKEEGLCQLFATKLAPKIQEAIEWLDEHEDEIPEFAEATWRVRLVTIPTFHTHAFLIQQLKNGSDVPIGESYIFVVSAPDWMESLPRHRLLRTKEFLDAFENKSPILGISGNTDIQGRESRV